MFEDFFNHRCNIYHLEDRRVNIGYGIEAGNVRVPRKEADEKDIPCHFHIKANGNMRITQKEPYAKIDGDVKLSLPAGTDIRKNDVVEDCSNGIKYRAGIPREVHGGHHIVVMLTCEEGTDGAL